MVVTSDFARVYKRIHNTTYPIHAQPAVLIEWNTDNVISPRLDCFHLRSGVVPVICGLNELPRGNAFARHFALAAFESYGPSMMPLPFEASNSCSRDMWRIQLSTMLRKNTYVYAGIFGPTVRYTTQLDMLASLFVNKLVSFHTCKSA